MLLPFSQALQTLVGEVWSSVPEELHVPAIFHTHLPLSPVGQGRDGMWSNIAVVMRRANPFACVQIAGSLRVTGINSTQRQTFRQFDQTLY